MSLMNENLLVEAKKIPRPEHPNPQMVREQWLNLNGSWDFEMDFEKTGLKRELFKAPGLSGKIRVPFCPESRLSGIGYTDFIPAVWYKRSFRLPEDWKGLGTLLHFGAVDYDAQIWVNGRPAGFHRGGYSSFTLDITDYLLSGEDNLITVYAEDDVRTGLQPGGKQSVERLSSGCCYTRTTGIWQTVWLEGVPKTYVSGIKLIPDPENACVHITGQIHGGTGNESLEATALYEGRGCGTGRGLLSGNQIKLTLKLSEVHLWGPGQPSLYDLKLTLFKDSQALDEVKSYFGLRTVVIRGKKILINSKSVFQRLILDQGFYPEGIYTAPSEEDLKKDIEISMEMGFNGARLHERAFEPRYLYWADKLGYLVWGEHANWQLDITTSMGLERFLPEWMELVERDYNHPAIIGWCPFNETWDKATVNEKTGEKEQVRQDDQVLASVYRATKLLDPTRPVIDTSGNFHVETDVFDVHDYEQNPELFKAHYEPMKNGGEAFVTFPDRQSYAGQPYMVSEYGGIWWNPGQLDEEGWGYGGTESRPKSQEAFLARYEGLTGALLDNPSITGFCYTQLYDVEQEVNGLYTYDRKAKFKTELLHAINSRPAAIEE